MSEYVYDAINHKRREDIVRCAGCSLAAVTVPCGFIAEPILRCTERNLSEVDIDDGCTMGVLGEPQPMNDKYDVDLSAAYGQTSWTCSEDSYTSFCC